MAHPSHVLEPQSDRVVAILRLAVLGVGRAAENPLVVQFLHQAALVVVQDGQCDLVRPRRALLRAHSKIHIP